MLEPFRKTAVLLAVVMVITVAIVLLFARLSEVSEPLLPVNASVYPLKVLVSSDQITGGASDIVLKQDQSTFDFELSLTPKGAYPWVAFTLEFDNFHQPENYVDWSRYSTLNLMMACEPGNTLMALLYTWDEITRAGDFSTFRNPSIYFDCYQSIRLIKISLTDLDVPNWWLRQHGLPLSNQEYSLDKVIGLAIHSSPQSPRGVPSNVTIRSATLEGRDWRYVYPAGALLVIIWSGFLFWIARQYSRLRIEKVIADARKDQPFIPYQQLPVVTRQDKTRSAVINYLAMQYADPELNIDAAANVLGVSRAKINEVLKEEQGLTFSAYLNKLRLAEAARLLREKDASVSEVSCAVGYNNTSYFITVFKKEYGITPKAFKSHSAKERSP